MIAGGELNKKQLAELRKSLASMELPPKKRQRLIWRLAKYGVIAAAKRHVRNQETSDGQKWPGVKRSAKGRCCGTCQNCCISVKCQKFRRYGFICRVVATGTGKRRYRPGQSDMRNKTGCASVSAVAASHGRWRPENGHASPGQKTAGAGVPGTHR